MLWEHLHELCYEIDDEELLQVFKHFKDVVDAKKNVTDTDLEGLVTDEFQGVQDWMIFR